jgi:hypothetical protein
MPKLTLTDLTTLSNDASAVAAINANMALIETAVENTLSRDGTTPNTMTANLDMNSQDILNADAIACTTLTVGGTSITAQVTAAAASATAAATSATAAATSATAAASSASAASTSAAAAAASATAAAAAVNGVKVSSDDTTPGDLETKILVGTGLSLSTQNGGANETRTISLDSSGSPQFAGLNIGHASDTTITRTGAGDIAVEGNAIYRAGGTDIPVTDGGTGASTAANARTNLGAAADADVVKADTTRQITVGYDTSPHDYGTISSGTVTVDIREGAQAIYTNNGAHTLTHDVTRNGFQDILITNGASAGAITTSDWDDVIGDSFDTTNGNLFLAMSRQYAGRDILIIAALQ